MSIESLESFTPTSQADWRQWLEEHHVSKQSVWVVFYKKGSSIPSLTWSESVDESLCYGWIDSVKKKRDDISSIQLFSKRKPKSTWSKINKEKINTLIESGKMTPAGMKCIETAKANGSWTILDSVEALIVPEELEEAFRLKPAAKIFYECQSKSVKKMILHRITLAKQVETRQNRIKEIVDLACEGKKPKGM
jgi:uncharacterized protein YdeI (YjbR/CyaY-like superfamily)